MTARKRKGSLGKDLDILLSASTSRTVDLSDAKSEVASEPAGVAAGDGLRFIPLELLQRGKYQPRRDFEQKALEELAESIRSQGVMQPIVVRPQGNDRFEIIAGERRWRASQLAGIDRIPAVVRDVSDEAAIAMSLIENIQRENLNAIEEAEALKRLQSEFDLSQQQVADRVGKSRSVIANLLRLLTLEPVVRELLTQGQLDTGHAKVLLALEGANQIKAAKQVVKGGLSVRQTEAMVKILLKGEDANVTPVPGRDPNISRLEQDLSGRLGAAVAIEHGKQGRGKVVINYTSLDELDGILRKIR